jgi:hypothetical protein
MSLYIVGSNLGGYLPMDDDPPTFDTWAEAYEYFQDFAREWADTSDEMFAELECGHRTEKEHTEQCFGSDRAFVDSVLADTHISEKTDPDGYSFLVRSNDGHAYSLWFTKTEG